MKKILFFLLLPFIIGVFAYHHAGAVDEVKTLSFFVGQATSSVSAVNFPFTFYLGDDAPVIKSAFFEVEGTSPNSGSLGITLSLSGGSGACNLTRTLDTTGRANAFRALYDVTSCINASGKGDYSRTLQISFSGGSVHAVSARLLLTYMFTPASNQGSNAVKTLVFPATPGTATTSISAGQSRDFPITFYIGDELTALKNAFFEVTGVSAAIASTTLTLSLSGGAGSCTLARVLDSSSQPNTFRILHNVTDCIDVPAKGEYSRTLTITSGSSAVHVYSVLLHITYRHTPPSTGGYKPSGTLISPVFDTNTVNGASFNSLLIKGPTVSGTKVRAQFATSNSSSSASFVFRGPDCTANSYYYDAALPASDTPYTIGCASDHHNKRFFRYKLVLCSANNCSTAGNATPEVQDIIVNWSP